MYSYVLKCTRIVPPALIIGALLIAYYLYRRRLRTDRDEIIAAAAKSHHHHHHQQQQYRFGRPKRLPDWLTNWTGSLRGRSSGDNATNTGRTLPSRASSTSGSLRKVTTLGEFGAYGGKDGGRGGDRGVGTDEVVGYKLDFSVSSAPVYEDDTASDVIALRPTELPAAPRPAYEARHHAFGFGDGLKPKLVVGL